MQLLTALALFAALSSAFGYKCYLCPLAPCSSTMDCADLFSDLFTKSGDISRAERNILTDMLDSITNITNVDFSDLAGLSYRCYTAEMSGAKIAGCTIEAACVHPLKCCEGDLCNSAPVTLPPVLLLGLAAFVTLYLNQD